MDKPFVEDPDDPDLHRHHYFGNEDYEQDEVIRCVNNIYAQPIDITPIVEDQSITKFTKLSHTGKIEQVYERRDGEFVDMTERYKAEQDLIDARLAYEHELRSLAKRAKEQKLEEEYNAKRKQSKNITT